MLCFLGSARNGDHKNFTKIPMIFQCQNSPGKSEKKNHRIFLESRQGNSPCLLSHLLLCSEHSYTPPQVVASSYGVLRQKGLVAWCTATAAMLAISDWDAHRGAQKSPAISDCDAHRGAQKSLAISETRQSNAALHFNLRVPWEVASCYFRVQSPFFLRDFWRCGSVSLSFMYPSL